MLPVINKFEVNGLDGFFPDFNLLCAVKIHISQNSLVHIIL